MLNPNLNPNPEVVESDLMILQDLMHIFEFRDKYPKKMGTDYIREKQTFQEKNIYTHVYALNLRTAAVSAAAASLAEFPLICMKLYVV